MAAKPICVAYSRGKCTKWRVPGQAGASVRFAGLGRSRRMTKAAQACVSDEISKHCRKKKGKCKSAQARAQAVAIGFSVCRRRGFKVPKR